MSDIVETEVYGFVCDKCGAEAVPVDGPGTECIENGCSGQYRDKSGNTYTMQMHRQAREEYSEIIVE